MAEPKRQDAEGDVRRRGPRDFATRLAEAGGVSATLRSGRLMAGLELIDVAGALRIQYRYLEAIEEGRFEDLPGPTYAIGFVRAYAEFLTLDSQELIRRFKDEVRGLDRRQALVFPEPLQEGRFPGGAVLLGALLLAVAVYGGWYYWEHRQLAASDTVAGVPDSLSRMAQEGAPAPLPSEPQPTSAAAAAPPEGPPPIPADAPPSAPAAAVNPAPATAPVPPKLALKPPEGTPPAAAPAAAPAAGADQAPPPAPPAPDQLASLKPGEPRVYGENNTDARIVLSAHLDSWVQVRDREGTVLWTRVLRAGESYRVPNQAGLNFATGNAGALDVTVDGRKAPPLGGIGIVRRNIPLDPEKLAAGTLPAQ